jgi:ankyrin repeat protein
MRTHSEATRLNLEFYRKQAKALLAAAKSGETEALERIAQYSPKFEETDNASAPALHDAQLTIAREQGFASWPRFKAFVEQSAADFPMKVETFVKAAVSDGRHAKELLAQNPGLAEGGIYPALVLGEVKRVEEFLAQTPGMVNVKGGPEAVVPLIYVCFSRFASRSSDRTEGMVETARLLLRHGADPNATCLAEGWPDNPLSCLYGATGLNNNPALGRVLLEAGANANDGESLYHSTEHADLECMNLLLAHGAKTVGSNCLKHMLDREEPEGLRLLLGAGADPDEVNERGETALHWAVWRGRSAPLVAILLDSGAGIDRKRNDGRTAYAMAVQSGQGDIAALLEKRGASTELSALDRFMGECCNADAEKLTELLGDAPPMAAIAGSERLLPDLTSTHQTAAVCALLVAGFPIDARGEAGGTALHWACWKGYADVVKILLERGASLTIEDEQFHGTPAGWFGHGVKNCRDAGSDYAKVARLLLAAGAQIPAADIPTGNPGVDAVLREHRLIE